MNIFWHFRYLDMEGVNRAVTAATMRADLGRGRGLKYKHLYRTSRYDGSRKMETYRHSDVHSDKTG